MVPPSLTDRTQDQRHYARRQSLGSANLTEPRFPPREHGELHLLSQRTTVILGLDVGQSAAKTIGCGGGATEGLFTRVNRVDTASRVSRCGGRGGAARNVIQRKHGESCLLVDAVVVVDRDAVRTRPIPPETRRPSPRHACRSGRAWLRPRPHPRSVRILG